ncbi:hypothetical protein VULLAG_LOCUS15342 [Vulpes lagopus]
MALTLGSRPGAINKIYLSLDEVLGKPLNAIVNCHFKEEKIDGFGKFMLFLH